LYVPVLFNAGRKEAVLHDLASLLKQLVARGVVVVPIFDPERVTHVVVNDGVTRERQFLSRAGLQSINEVPEHIPILRWEWIEQSERKRALQPTHQFSAFDSRITYPQDYFPVPPEPPKLSVSKSAVQPERNTGPIPKRRAVHSDSEDSNGSCDDKISCVASYLCSHLVTPASDLRAIIIATGRSWMNAFQKLNR
jgi:hypothetical protein